ncbi:kanadaptin [Tripterygium wilfordii]|uniref:Kanadaptin n=1 Tax=Tripterygium wilfordii TaxID=458696 RepID=A0A7J7DR96_TRIWF|nr:kanadaptin [Tripterygium wilfordii]KAF5748898.1 kanadaptin [Tripterygium wilfordii]
MTTAMGPPLSTNPNNSSEPEFEQETLMDDPATTTPTDTATATTTKAPMAPPPPKNTDPTNLDSEEPRKDDLKDPPESDSQQAAKHNSVPYTIPEWSGPPCHKFHLEVLKDGSIFDKLDVFEKGAYMFGRVDLCDFVLEHPTISRFHAVLQFKRSGDAYLYDLGSTHGTFINKKQVQKNIFVDLHVGDVVRFGLSSRLYVFQGPPELMPSEVDLKITRDAKMREERLDREASLKRARMEASLAEGISWGMGEDAIEEAEDDGDEITWQTYRGQLTEKQEKTREKVLKRTQKIAHMKKEIDAIRAKDISQGGLTQGQQTQIARNEQRIAQVFEELENLEETLNESIRESIGARGGILSHRKKGATEDDEEFLSDEDEFYDRTKKRPKKKIGESQSVETADTLLEKRDDIMREMEDKKELLLAEKNKMASETSEETEAGDVLDAYMSGLSSQLVLDKTAELEKELSSLQSELDRVVFLLKIADPTGETAKKRDSIALAPKPVKSETPGAPLKKQPSSEPNKKIGSEKPMNVPTKKEGTSDDVAIMEGSNKKLEADKEGSNKKLEADKNLSDADVEKIPAYTVVKPQWLGAVGDREVKKPQQEADTLNTHDADQFVDYKDRKKILGDADVTQVDSGIESAAPGLIIRKPKQSGELKGSNPEVPEQSTSSTVRAEFKAEDAVALLLKHKRGYCAEDDEGSYESQEILDAKDNKKPKRVLGPERPSFLNSNSDYESWVPPKGQSGDGRTSLNDQYGY